VEVAVFGSFNTFVKILPNTAVNDQQESLLLWKKEMKNEDPSK
jgi:hypothetical protein